jgi:uncharacterized protein YqeY
MAAAALKNAQIAKQSNLTEDDEIKVIQRLVSQREESIEHYQKASRMDQVEKEQQEMTLIKIYLPQPISDEELTGIIQNTIAKLRKTSSPTYGEVMKKVVPQVKGRAPGKKISELAIKLLTQ